MLQAKNATTAEQLVSEADYVQLSRLVIEHGLRVDNGRADTVHELYLDDGELIVPSGANTWTASATRLGSAAG